ncbi:hypothetical protein CDV36_004125 [Fusarium kuroshium]|uniref:Uncharacterized protein n=1 Tax=Fusarium kuroshium TaxID=2010991 RepID=A0A3M2SGG8_9HYPO|nr:hypothetical protein CDV36_004125 [Fusarium kuroshium]
MTESGGATSWLRAVLGAAAKKAAANLDFDALLAKHEAQANQEKTRWISQRECDQNYETARNLAALFQGLWPDTPNLIRAYRDRVSEIYRLARDDNSELYLAEPRFASLVGLQGITLTSPESVHRGVIQMHLLACILAHAWNPSEAMLAWSELVEQRRQKITSDVEKGIESPFSAAAVAAEEYISSSQLGFWDCNARAWLQMTQTVLMRDQMKVEQVLKNAELPVGKSILSYQRVIPTWLSALAALENLVLGRPQEAQDGDILQAISAWNIYPDLYVFGPKNTEAHFHDRLVPRTGIITIGCDPGARAQSNNMFRSLSLSQL